MTIRRMSFIGIFLPGFKFQREKWPEKVNNICFVYNFFIWESFKSFLLFQDFDHATHFTNGWCDSLLWLNNGKQCGSAVMVDYFTVLSAGYWQEILDLNAIVIFYFDFTGNCYSVVNAKLCQSMRTLFLIIIELSHKCLIKYCPNGNSVVELHWNEVWPKLINNIGWVALGGQCSRLQKRKFRTYEPRDQFKKVF